MSELNLPSCIVPQALPSNPTADQKLKHLGELRTYRLCQIQSAQKHMEYLALELSKDSVQAGIQTRNLVRQFAELEMAFLEDIRRKISVELKKLNPDA